MSTEPTPVQMSVHTRLEVGATQEDHNGALMTAGKIRQRLSGWLLEKASENGETVTEVTPTRVQDMLLEFLLMPNGLRSALPLREDEPTPKALPVLGKNTDLSAMVDFAFGRAIYTIRLYDAQVA